MKCQLSFSEYFANLLYYSFSGREFNFVRVPAGVVNFQRLKIDCVRYNVNGPQRVRRYSLQRKRRSIKSLFRTNLYIILFV